MKCPQCSRDGFKGNKGVLMHIGRVHTGIIKVPSGPMKDRVKRVARIDGELQSNSNTAVLSAIKPERLMRPSREVREVLSAHSHFPKKRIQFELNSCPNCTFPLDIVDKALESKGIPPAQFCANCTFPLKVVRTAIKLSEKY